MNWDRIRGHWKQLTGRAQERWGTLTHDHRAIAAWKRRVKDHLFNSDRR